MFVCENNYFIVDDCKYSKRVFEVKKLNEDLIEYPCVMFLDQATKTGIAVFDNKKRLIKTIFIKREETESLLRYRDKFKKFISNLIDKYKVKKLFCEDVFGGSNFETTEMLLSIKTNLEDIAFTKGIKFYCLVNTKWKARLSYPNHWNKAKNDKEQIQKYVKEYFNIVVEEDVYDALGMGIAVLYKTTSNMRPLEMRLNKKLPIDRGVFVICDYKEIDDIIDGNFRNSKELLEIKKFDYDPKLSLDVNFRYMLSNFNVLGVCKIPYHRYYGQILLEFNIRPSDIPSDGFLVGIGRRKKWKIF